MLKEVIVNDTVMEIESGTIGKVENHAYHYETGKAMVVYRLSGSGISVVTTVADFNERFKIPEIKDIRKG